MVLKPLDMSEQTLDWQAHVLGSVSNATDFRVAPPLRSGDGSLSVAGWTASPYLPGEPATGHWRDILVAGERFHAALGHLPRPAFLETRQDHWAVADRVAWGELPLTGYEDDDAILALAGRLLPVHETSQVVHGDLSGNVLVHPRLPPAILDLSPYWRPPAYASAVVLADALLWHDAGEEVLELDVPSMAQHLLRALIFRLVTERRAAHGARRPDGRYGCALRIACAVADRRGPATENGARDRG